MSMCLVQNYMDPSSNYPPALELERFPMDILHRIADWSHPNDVTQFAMASKLFRSIRTKLFAKRKTLIIEDGMDLDEVSKFIKETIEFVDVKESSLDLTRLEMFSQLHTLYLMRGGLSDLSPLESFINLKHLNLYSNF
ncbi:hypothetical protein BC833DRAFT_632119, partial [Globomyces pollinis-pini]